MTENDTKCVVLLEFGSCRCVCVLPLIRDIPASGRRVATEVDSLTRDKGAKILDVFCHVFSD